MQKRKITIKSGREEIQMEVTEVAGEQPSAGSGAEGNKEAGGPAGEGRGSRGVLPDVWH